MSENVNKITIINGRLNNQIIANVEKCIFYKCQVINTTFKNTKDIYFKECIVENVSFSSVDTTYQIIDHPDYKLILTDIYNGHECYVYEYQPFKLVFVD